MRRFIIIFSILITAQRLYPEMPVDFYIQSEYRKDTIDYSQITKYYYREKTAIFFSRDSRLNFTCIYLDREHEKKYTWNLILKDISQNVSFLTGNFFTDFGSGLLTGKKRYFNPDIFSNRTEKILTQIFSPCNSGNPAFAFNGLSASFRMDFPLLIFSINSFYSIKENFIDENSYDNRAYQGSIQSIEGKISKDYKGNEPVNIHTHGSMISAQVMKNLQIQTYYLFTGIKTPGENEKIIWDYRDSGNTCGTSGLSGGGFYIMYSDDFLSYLFDSCVTIRERTVQDNKKKHIKGYGFLYGLKFTPPFLELSITGKDVDNEYYSPYSSSIGEDYPEKAWFFDTGIRPFGNLKLGASVSSQKKTSPGQIDIESPAARREEIYFQYSYGILKNIDTSIRKVDRTNNGIIEKKNQFRESIDLKISDIIAMEFSGIYQEGNKVRRSGILDTGIDLLFLSYFKVDINYIKAYISEDNAIYTVISPIRFSSSPGFFINVNSNTIVSRLNFKYEKIFISFRYLYQFTGNKYLYSRLEFSGNGRF